MAKALGMTEEEEYQPNLRLLAEKLQGDVGILFTNQSVDQVKT
jgi:mRNA turnover protein 4